VLARLETVGASPKVSNAGILDIFRSIYRPDQVAEYREQMLSSPNGAGLTGADLDGYYGDWLTYQWSDHKPLWVRLKTNDAADYLATLKAAAES
jgi:hypothetical protein